jgi:hypothetical protein
MEPEVAAAPTTAAAIDLARRVTNAPSLLKHLEDENKAQEDASVNGRRDAIELWNKAAQEESLEYDWNNVGRIKAVEEALAFYADAKESPKEKPDVLAWHDHTTVLIPISSDASETMAFYTPSLRDENRIERLRYRYATPEHELETILDWRGYFGANSVIVDGWTKMRQQGQGYVVSVAGTADYVVCHVFRRLVRRPVRLTQDPWAKGRLIQMCERYGHIATACPNLSRMEQVAQDQATVFVHGTASCGIQGLKDFYATQRANSTFRYEHDTYRPIKENGEELAELVEKSLHVKELALVGHSRGGLVARYAAAQLAKRNYTGKVEVLTFGTPHLGTPLAAMGDEVLNLLVKLGGDVIGGIPHLSWLGKAYSFLIKSPRLPDGIEEMREDSGFLSAMNGLGNPGNVRCWGSNIDMNTSNTGFGVFVNAALSGALHGVEHDLIVPKPSALGFGTPQPSFKCSHVQYFTEAAAQKAIADLSALDPSKYVGKPLELKKGKAGG